ncbi:MAG TPA: sulfate ABC transporter permease subunit CysT [Candidatus Hydrogenedentes bacterium]|nr:sulfate ABC transporter permease subunit CysT [Candidatus Hydrogenedentota bacterium]
MKRFRFNRFGLLPGFGLTLGITLSFLGLLVLLPFTALTLRTLQISPEKFWEILASPRITSSFRLTFLTALVAAFINAAFGFLVAWTLTRYSFPGRRVVDAVIDLPFALPTAISGIALTALYAPNGWLGHFLAKLGIQVAYTPAGIVLALVFIGFPFVVRTLQPAIADLEDEYEEAAASLGANRWQTFIRVIFPAVLPALLTGTTMAFARALGEYGSIVFISGNMPYRTEILPLLIITRLEQFDYAGATVLAVAMLAASFTLLVIANLIQGRITRYAQESMK